MLETLALSILTVVGLMLGLAVGCLAFAGVCYLMAPLVLPILDRIHTRLPERYDSFGNRIPPVSDK